MATLHNGIVLCIAILTRSTQLLYAGLGQYLDGQVNHPSEPLI